jgi:hypothetical protein
LCGNDWTDGVQTKHISHEWLRLTISRDDIGDLDDGINVCLRKDAFATSAFDIEGEDTEGSHFRIFALRRMSNQVAVVELCLDLAIGVLIPWVEQLVLASWYLDPGHTGNLGIDHEPQNVCDVVECENAIFTSWPESLPVGISFRHHGSHAVDHLRVDYSNLQVWALLVALIPQYVLAHRHLD